MKRLKEQYEHEKSEYLKGYKILHDENKEKEKQITTYRNNMVIKDRQIQYKSKKDRESKERDLSNGRVSRNNPSSKSLEKVKNGNNNYQGQSQSSINLPMQRNTPNRNSGATRTHDYKEKNTTMDQKYLLDKMNKELEELEYKFEQPPRTHSPYQDSHAKFNQNITCVKTPNITTQTQFYNRNFENNNNNNNVYQYEDLPSIKHLDDKLFNLDRINAELKVNHKSTRAKMNVNINYIIFL